MFAFLNQEIFSALIFSVSRTWFFAEFHMVAVFFSIRIHRLPIGVSHLDISSSEEHLLCLTTPKIRCLCFLSHISEQRSHFTRSVFSLFEQCPRAVEFASSVFTRIEWRRFICLFVYCYAYKALIMYRSFFMIEVARATWFLCMFWIFNYLLMLKFHDFEKRKTTPP